VCLSMLSVTVDDVVLACLSIILHVQGYSK
jgi:hypothetical protein